MIRVRGIDGRFVDCYNSVNCYECKDELVEKDVYYFLNTPYCQNCYNEMVENVFSGLEKKLKTVLEKSK